MFDDEDHIEDLLEAINQLQEAVAQLQNEKLILYHVLSILTGYQDPVANIGADPNSYQLKLIDDMVPGPAGDEAPDHL